MRKPKFRIIENGLGQFWVQTRDWPLGDWIDIVWFDTLNISQEYVENRKKEINEFYENKKKRDTIVRVWK